MPRKLIIKGPKEGGISLSREKYDRMLNPRKSIAYLILSDKPYDYPRRSSRIMYIGQTTKKNERPFTSLTERARRIFKKHPKAEELTVHYVETGKRKGRTLISEELERALLSEFKMLHDARPVANESGGEYRKYLFTKYFKQASVWNIIDKMATARRKERRRKKRKKGSLTSIRT